MSTNPLYLIYIDGASFGNPGPSGIGVTIYQDGKKIDGISREIGNATNNIAEYKALIEALKLAKKNSLKNIKIYSDSLLVVKQIKGEYLVRDAILRKLYKVAIGYLKEFPKAEIEHINSCENKEANRLAQSAIIKEKRNVCV